MNWEPSRARPPLFFLACFLFLFAPLRLCVRSSAADWSNWRGPWQNGDSPERPQVRMRASIASVGARSAGPCDA